MSFFGEYFGQIGEALRSVDVETFDAHVVGMDFA